MYFPDIFHNVLSTAFWSKLKEKGLMIVQYWGKWDDAEEKALQVERYLASLIKPKSFSGKDNAELRSDSDFDKTCILLSSLTNKPVRELTTREYFALIRHYNDSIKSNGRKSNPQGRHN